MEEFINVDEKRFIYECNYREDETLRNSFNYLTRKTFNFDFKNWYEGGYWKEKYIPCSLIDGTKVVANVSVNICDFIVLGEKKRYIQLGTVMTDKDYRGMGLSRFLMEKVLKTWENKCDFIYLYANDNVLNFYPKFGFVEIKEYEYFKYVSKKEFSSSIRKMDVNNKKDKAIITNAVLNRVNNSKVTAVDNLSLVMFYVTSFMKEDIYYVEEYDAVVICEFKFDTLYLKDVFSLKEISLDHIINGLLKEGTKKVILGFTPKDTSSYETKLVCEKDTTFFIRGDKKNIFKTHKLMFPILSHA